MRLSEHEMDLCSVNGRLNSIWNSILVAFDNFQGVPRVLFEDLRKTIHSRYMPAVVLDGAKEIYASYRAFQRQLHLYPMPDRPEYSDPLRSMRNVIRPAILYEQLEDANWFRERLRVAADQFDPDQPAGDVSTPQKDNPVQTDGAKKTTRSEIDYYDQSQDTMTRRTLGKRMAQRTTTGDDSDYELRWDGLKRRRVHGNDIYSTHLAARSRVK